MLRQFCEWLAEISRYAGGEVGLGKTFPGSWVVGCSSPAALWSDGAAPTARGALRRAGDGKSIAHTVKNIADLTAGALGSTQ